MEFWESSRVRPSAFDCSRVGRLRLTSSFLLANPSRKPLTLSCTAALVLRRWFPVASCLAQPHTDSSALKSGL